MNKKFLFYGAIFVLALIALAGGYVGYSYASTPEHIRKPAYEHYHFRTQLVVNGKAVDFAADKFQQHYDASSCSAEVGSHPIDFHDKVDQMTHVHWKGMTGGEFLKYFGWNYIGGDDGILGRRFDQGFKSMPSVKIFGRLLPEVSKDTKFYVYVGDQDSYQPKKWQDFLRQDLETFFGKKSNIGGGQTSWLNIGDWLFKKALAHGGVQDNHSESEGAKSDEELKRINNLIGNVVIFAQKEEPTKSQVQERFNKLVPLKDSSCGG